MKYKKMIAVVTGIIIVIIGLYIAGFRITYNPNLITDWDAVSGCAAWAGVIASVVAIWYAIQVPKKIADRQDKIALFEKRIDIYKKFKGHINSCQWSPCAIFNEAYPKEKGSIKRTNPLSEEILSLYLVISMLFPQLKNQINDLHQIEKKIYSIDSDISTGLGCLKAQNLNRVLELFEQQERYGLTSEEQEELHKKSNTCYEDYDGEKNFYVPCNLYEMDNEQSKYCSQFTNLSKKIISAMESEIQIG